MRRFDYLSSPEAFAAGSQEGSTLVWPFGACEQHGPHLPLNTDTFFAEKILREVLDHLPSDVPIWMLPAQKIGFSPEHLGFPGTLSISAEMMLRLVSEIGRQIADMNFNRLILFNAHGGQIGLLQAVARQLRVECSSMAVLPCFLWSGVDSLDEHLPQKEIEEGLHAALAETSLMMHMCENLVGIERPVEGGREIEKNVNMIPKGWSLEGTAPCAWLTQDISKSGVIGDSRNSNTQLGAVIEEKLVSHWSSLFSSLLESEWPPVSMKKS